ncbi:MAG TPA: ribonuclease PH, partial [Gammaproteobacteria bacterium]|nr:ribonuclease PH [Gammaproteobacteria bacterium]
WLSAEYALLPAATQVRTNREISVMKRQGRSIEISRLISRALRTVIDLTVIGERTITVDCDVLLADGGTRTASITAAYAALLMAQQEWLASGVITKPVLIDGIAAVSVGVMKDNQLILDLDYEEDSSAIADINVIMTYSGKLIELQGGAEKESVSWDIIPKIGQLATQAVFTMRDFISANPAPAVTADVLKQSPKTALFSLANRQSRQLAAP